ncbi:hypothetical protein ACOSP7_013250 [Xanthoceras sorbifolium]
MQAPISSLSLSLLIFSSLLSLSLSELYNPNDKNVLLKIKMQRATPPLATIHEADLPRNLASARPSTCVSGLDSLFVLHLSGHLMPKLSLCIYSALTMFDV